MSTGPHEQRILAPVPPALADGGDGLGLRDMVAALAGSWKLLVSVPLLAALAALGLSFLIQPTFTARTTFLPPQQQQNAAASALVSLSALAGLAGGAAGIKNVADQYVALMQSTTLQDRLVDQYKLMEVYEAKYRFEARKALQDNVRISLGKKDGLITVDVDDKNPDRAARLANSHVDELRRMTNVLAVTEAQQRRAFFGQELERSKDRLTKAQQALQATGFSQGALRAEPKAAADSYARLRAEVTAAEVRLQTMRSQLNDSAPEFRQQQAQLNALRGQLSRAEQVTDPQSGPDYISKYRDFKYEEALFDLFARQYEIARIDESREGALIQVVDPAQPPERKSRPKRALITLGALSASLLLCLVLILARRAWRQDAAGRHDAAGGMAHTVVR